MERGKIARGMLIFGNYRLPRYSVTMNNLWSPFRWRGTVGSLHQSLIRFSHLILFRILLLLKLEDPECF